MNFIAPNRTIHHWIISFPWMFFREAVGDTRANAKLQAGFARFATLHPSFLVKTDGAAEVFYGLAKNSKPARPKVSEASISDHEIVCWSTTNPFVDMVHALGISLVQCLFEGPGRIFLASGSCQSCILLWLLRIFVLPRLEISKPRYDYYVQVIGWRYDCWSMILPLLLIVGGQPGWNTLSIVRDGESWKWVFLKGKNRPLYLAWDSSEWGDWDFLGFVRERKPSWDINSRGMPLDEDESVGLPVDPVDYFPCISRTKTSLVQGNLPWRRHLWEKAPWKSTFLDKNAYRRYITWVVPFFQ